MSELKAINAYQLTTNTEDSDVYIHNDEFGCGGDLVECYLKSEADKVIAELKQKLQDQCASCPVKMQEDDAVAELKEQVHDYAQGLYAIQARAEKELRHQKYKRCLAMAQQSFNERTYWHYRYDDWGDKGYDRKYKWSKVEWYGKWGRMWLKLAEKFKEAK